MWSWFSSSFLDIQHCLHHQPRYRSFSHSLSHFGNLPSLFYFLLFNFSILIFFFLILRLPRRLDYRASNRHPSLQSLSTQSPTIFGNALHSSSLFFLFHFHHYFMYVCSMQYLRAVARGILGLPAG